MFLNSFAGTLPLLFNGVPISLESNLVNHLLDIQLVDLAQSCYYHDNKPQTTDIIGDSQEQA